MYLIKGTSHACRILLTGYRIPVVHCKFLHQINGFMAATTNNANDVRSCHLHRPRRVVKESRMISSNAVTSTGVTRNEFRNQSSPDQSQHYRQSNSEALDKLLERIAMDVRRKGRIHHQSIDEAISFLEKEPDAGDRGIMLLKYCSRQFLPDIQSSGIVHQFQRCWNIIERQGNMTPEHLEILLLCYTNHEFLEFNPWELLKQFEAAIDRYKCVDIRFLNRIYYLALLSFCQRGDLPNAIKVLELVKRQGFLVDETYFNALILGNSRAGDISSAKEILSIMKSSLVNPSMKTFTTLMQACIEHNDLTALATVYNISRREISLSEHEIVELASKCVFARNMCAFEKILAWFPAASQTEDSLKTFNLIVTLIHSGFSMEAMKILSHWARGIHLSVRGFGVSFIKELVYANIDKHLLIALCNELMSKGHNNLAFNCAAEFSLRKKQFECALMLFKVMKEHNFPIRPHYFWPMIIHNFGTEGLTGMTKTLEAMSSFEVLPDWDTYSEHIVPKLFSIESDPIQVAKILKESSGVSYSSGIFTVMLHHLLKHKRLGDASALATRFKGSLSQPNALVDLIFRCLLNVESRENIITNLNQAIPILETIYEGKPSEDKTDYVGKFVLRFLDSIGTGMLDLPNILIQSLEKAKIPISETAAEIIQMKTGKKYGIKIEQQLVLMEQTHFNKPHTHPKDMDIQSLECHVQELKSKGMNTRGILRRLFLKYCQAGELSKALEIKTEFQEHGAVTQGMRGALLALYIRKGNVDPALEIYKELIDPGKSLSEDWNLDLHKLVDLVTLMAEQGRNDQAFTLLINDGCKYPAPENGLNTRNVVKMLEGFRKHGSTTEGNSFTKLQTILNFLLDNQIITANAPVLSILIKDLLEHNEIHQALDLFEEYAKTYKLTPGSQLICYSVLKNPELLDRYTKACSSVHGKTNTLYQLAYSQSDIGQAREASQIFVELGNKFDLTRILKYCEHLSDKKEISKILNIAQSVSITRRNIDTSGIYLIALQACQRLQDPETVRLILDRIEQELPINPSASVLQYMEKVKGQSDLNLNYT